MRFIFQKNHPIQGFKNNKYADKQSISCDDGTVLTAATSLCSEGEGHPFGKDSLFQHSSLGSLSHNANGDTDEDDIFSESSVVRFEAQPEIMGDSANGTVDVEVCWYDAQDFKGFKKSARTQSLECALNPSKGEHQYRSVLQTVFERCCDAQAPKAGDDDKNEPVALSPQDQQRFKRMITKSSSRCGLERTVLEGMKLNISGRRRRLVQMACHLSALGQGDDDDDDDDDDAAEQLAQSLRELSWPSACWAREMGRCYATNDALEV